MRGWLEKGALPSEPVSRLLKAKDLLAGASSSSISPGGSSTSRTRFASRPARDGDKVAAAARRSRRRGQGDRPQRPARALPPLGRPRERSRSRERVLLEMSSRPDPRDGRMWSRSVAGPHGLDGSFVVEGASDVAERFAVGASLGDGGAAERRGAKRAARATRDPARPPGRRAAPTSRSPAELAAARARRVLRLPARGLAVEEEAAARSDASSTSRPAGERRPRARLRASAAPRRSLRRRVDSKAGGSSSRRLRRPAPTMRNPRRPPRRGYAAPASGS